MNFEWAMNQIFNGYRVCRACWCKGFYISNEKIGKIETVNRVKAEKFNNSAEAILNYRNGKIVGFFSVTPTAIRANDWQLFEEDKFNLREAKERLKRGSFITREDHNAIYFLATHEYCAVNGKLSHLIPGNIYAILEKDLSVMQVFDTSLNKEHSYLEVWLEDDGFIYLDKV